MIIFRILNLLSELNLLFIFHNENLIQSTAVLTSFIKETKGIPFEVSKYLRFIRIFTWLALHDMN